MKTPLIFFVVAAAPTSAPPTFNWYLQTITSGNQVLTVSPTPDASGVYTVTWADPIGSEYQAWSELDDGGFVFLICKAFVCISGALCGVAV